MRKINFKILIITSIVCLLSIILGVIFYNQLPEQVPVHFDINNNPDNYFPKLAFVIGLPILMTLVQIWLCVTKDLADKHAEANQKASTVFKWIIPIVTIILYIVTLMFALGKNLDIRKIVMSLLGVMFIVMGNYIPKTKGMAYLHLVYKITDENLINKINRISGYMLIINGLLLISTILFDTIVSISMFIIFIIQGIGLTIYAHTRNKKGESYGKKRS